MWRSRCLTLLAVLVLSSLLMAATGWCGGPPVSREPGVAPFMGAPAPAADVGRSTSFISDVSFAGSTGTGEMPGTVGRSPRLRSEVYGVSKNGFTVGVRAQTRIQYKGLGAKIYGDYLTSRWAGDGRYTSPLQMVDPTTGIVYYRQGDSLESEYYSRVITLTADIDVGTAGSVGGVLDVGPRFQLANFAETLQVINSTQHVDGSGSTSTTMGGGGIWANIDFIKLFGIEGKFFQGYQHGVTFYPKLALAASLGANQDGRFHSWEAFIKLFCTSKDLFKNKYVKYAPALSGEIGYINYHFKETKDDLQAAQLQTATGQYVAPLLGNADMGASLLVARGYLTF